MTHGGDVWTLRNVTRELLDSAGRQSFHNNEYAAQQYHSTPRDSTPRQETAKTAMVREEEEEVAVEAGEVETRLQQQSPASAHSTRVDRPSQMGLSKLHRLTLGWLSGKLTGTLELATYRRYITI